MRGSNTLTAEQHARVTAAITRAEKATSGEIHCVLARRSDAYLYPAVVVAATAILMLGPFLALALDRWWLVMDPAAFAAAQLAAFLTCGAVLAALPAMRIALVPPALKYRRAHENAHRQFLAHNIHATKGRTGVLIFVSLAERYVEIVADREIDAHVGQSEWNEVVAGLLAHARGGTLADGFVEAVERVGGVLARHFPAGAGGANEIEDRLTEI